MTDQLTIRVNGNISDYEASLEKITNKTKRLQDNLTSIAKKASVAFVGLAAAVTGSIAAFRTQEQVEFKTQAVIKSTGQAANLTANEIFKMAGALQDVTTFGDEAIIGGQNLLLTFKNIGKDVFPQATETMLNMSEAMGTGLKESAIQLGKALNDPKVGLTALQRVGITFNETQKEQIKTMQEAGDVAGAQKIILKELESQFGGMARAAAKGTGAFIQLQNIVGDLVEDLGRELAPTFIEVAQEAKAFFLTLRENKELIKTVATVLKFSLGLAGIVAIAATTGVAILKLSAIIGALSAVFLPATIAASGFWAAVTGPIGIAVAGIASVTAAATALFLALEKKEPVLTLKQINKQLETKKEKLKELRKAIKENSVFNDEAARIQQRKLFEEIKALEKLNDKKIIADKIAKAHAGRSIEQIDSEIRQREILANIVRVNAKRNNELDNKATEDRFNNIQKEITALRELRAEKIKKGEEEDDQKALDRAAAAAEALKNQRQTEFEDKKSQLLENQELLTEEELEAAQEAAELKEEQKAENELIAQAAELERKGEHDKALTLLEDARIAKQIKDTEKIKKLNDKAREDEAKAKKKADDEAAKEAKKRRDEKEQIRKVSLAATQNFLTLGADLAKEGSKTQQNLNAANALISTFTAASAALANPPGPPFSIPLAASITAIGLANVAKIKGAKFAEGGMFTGGIPGVDSIPALVQRNEIIAPTQNFEEVIGSVRAKREAEDLTGEGGFGGGQQVDIRVSYDSPEASQIVTVNQVEDTALGISRDSFKESA